MISIYYIGDGVRGPKRIAVSKNLLEAFWTDPHVLLKVQKYGIHSLEIGNFPTIYKGFIRPGWCRISSINSILCLESFGVGKTWGDFEVFRSVWKCLKSIFRRWFRGKESKRELLGGFGSFIFKDFYSPKKSVIRLTCCGTHMDKK